MPDSPDYSKFLGSSIRFSLQDMGELAARLGSPSIYDRRGEVIWYDRCEHGLGSWFLQGAGTGYDTVLVADNQLFSGYAYKLTAGSSLTLLARMTKQLALFDTSNIGFECAWYHDNKVASFDMKIQFATGGVQYQSAIRHDVTNSKIQYQDASNSWVDLMNLSLPIISGSAYRFTKLVISMSDAEYRRVYIGTSHNDDLEIPIYNAGAFSTDFFQVVIEVTSVSGQNGNVHIGQVLITANEP